MKIDRFHPVHYVSDLRHRQGDCCGVFEVCSALVRCHPQAILGLIYHVRDEWKILNSHPCQGVKQFKESNRRPRFLTAEECKTLLDACPGADATLRQVIELALNTGMRKSEVLRLKWEHANLRQEDLEILDQKNGEYSTIPLDKRALEILRSIPRRFDSPYVFTGKSKGQPFWDLNEGFVVRPA
jgi:integrase